VFYSKAVKFIKYHCFVSDAGSTSTLQTVVELSSDTQICRTEEDNFDGQKKVKRRVHKPQQDAES
jgi:hypothetical protein